MAELNVKRTLKMLHELGQLISVGEDSLSPEPRNTSSHFQQGACVHSSV